MNTQFIEEHYKNNRKKLVKRMFFRTGGNEAAAEDIVQSSYELAIRYMASFRGENFDVWFNTIMFNTLRKYQNEEKGYVHSDSDDEETTEDTSCPHFPSRVMKEILDLIDTKAVHQVEILNLHFKHEYSALDIANITVYPHATIRQVIHRFRNEIKELYGK